MVFADIRSQKFRDLLFNKKITIVWHVLSVFYYNFELKKMKIRILSICFLWLLFSFSYSQKRLISNFNIEGNKKLKTSIINTIAQVSSGAVLDSLSIEEDIKQLKRLPSVSHADYEIHYSENKKECEVTYRIEENLTIIPSLNIYNSINDDLAYKVALFEFNLLGRNMTVSGFYENNVRSSYGFSFRAPYLFGERFGIGFNFQKGQAIEPMFAYDSPTLFNYGNDSCEIMGLYQINFKNRVELGMNHFFESYEQLTEQELMGFPERINLKKTAIKGLYEHTTLDYKYQYVSGFVDRVNLQYIQSSSNLLNSHALFRNDFSYFKRAGNRGNLATRLRLGFSTNNTVFAPFLVDNNLNIRGVGNVVDRGSGIAVLNTEYRHTLLEKGWFVLQSNAFLDSGTILNSPTSFDDFLEIENIRVYSGVGLRFIHKSIFNAIFRLDYGVCLTATDSNNGDRGLVFGIGQYF